MTNEQLRRVLTRGEGGARTERSACPPSESLASFAVHELAPGEAGSVLDHLTACRDCAEETRALLALAREWSGSLVDLAPHGRHRPAAGLKEWPRGGPAAWIGPGAWKWLVPAGAAAAIVGVGFLLQQRSSVPERSEPRLVRGAQEDPAAAGGWRFAPDPRDGATLPEPPRTLFANPARGNGGPGQGTGSGPAPEYSAALYDSESSPVWESGTSPAARFQLPETVRKGLKPGAAYYWRVFVRERSGTSQSPLFRFSIAR